MPGDGDLFANGKRDQDAIRLTRRNGSSASFESTRASDIVTHLPGSAATGG